MILSFLDITIIGLLGVSAIHGFFRGFLTISVKLVSMILAITLAFNIYPATNVFLEGYISSHTLASFFAVVSAFFASFMMFSLVSAKFLAVAGKIKGGVSDKLFGVLIGLFRGGVYLMATFLIVIIFFSGSYKEQDNTRDLLLASASAKTPSWLDDSLLVPHLKRSSIFVAGFLPLSYIDKYYTNYYRSEYKRGEEPESGGVEEMFNENFGEIDG